MLTFTAVTVAAVVSAAVSAAPTCRAMTIGYSLSSGQFVVLSPGHVDIALGGCVRFSNQTAATATVTVGSHYSRQVPPNSSTSGSSDYVGTTSGRQAVTATSGSASAPGSTAHGSITVAAAPAPAPSSARPHSKTPTPAPAPSTVPTSSGGTGPQVAPTPSAHRHSRSAAPTGGGAIQPPVSPAGPIQLPPSQPPSPQATAVATGPVEPPSGRGIGMPAALAALGVVGTGAALVRVIAAEPVDNPKSVVRPS